MIDWDVARRTAATFAGSGPEVEPHEAAGVVEALRSAAEVAAVPVSEYTGLKAIGTPAPVLVVDRRRWTEANLSSFEDLLEPVMTKLADQAPGRLSRAVGSRVSGAELGGLLAFMSSKVLGQFDPFWTGPDGAAQ
ncbi:MAG: coenzyme F420 biosynthesis-associated protein, partial [Actinomycetales bacterium]